MVRVAQEAQAIGALPAGIRIGKVHADVAQRRRAQQRIGDRVRQHIGVGVPFETEFAGNGDAAQYQRPPGNDAVDIPALACAVFTQDQPLPWRKAGPAPCRWAW